MKESIYCIKCKQYPKVGNNPYCSKCFDRIISKLEAEEEELTHKNILKIFNESLKAERYCKRLQE